uniref:Uncharacterized protein n=1 Tax=Panagrolaimus sp. JU765 TaxID=591449 RepID=A0AC34PXR5_9BILA
MSDHEFEMVIRDAIEAIEVDNLVDMTVINDVIAEGANDDAVSEGANDDAISDHAVDAHAVEDAIARGRAAELLAAKEAWSGELHGVTVPIWEQCTMLEVRVKLLADRKSMLGGGITEIPHFISRDALDNFAFERQRLEYLIPIWWVLQHEVKRREPG